ncbi:type II secretion system F family protein [Corynebacterium aquatimens]|uniref:type II secretion system F family protein n=1 Tax=Corynebacterium TaxID=1716 RepID=UPI001F3F3F72|nr:MULTISPECIES: type II secretion system F family protein [Corynebacterium]QYH20376.1 type II secretion system F family protein [Corynebacterium aquatimens]UIZ92325.1 type II secretion system F family protein [Corynebacterium sp. CNCTC7651]
MISLTTAALAALAIVVTAPRPAVRLTAVTAEAGNRPRDGPRTGSPAGSRAGTRGADPHRCASDISLFAACATAGLPSALAAAAVADTHRGEHTAWHTTAALLALGADPERAWFELAAVPGGADLANLVTLSNASGAALADGCGRIAARLRAEAADGATAKAERAGVLIAIPLTACFLPAFFALGLAPVVISLGAGLIH